MCKFFQKSRMYRQLIKHKTKIHNGMTVYLCSWACGVTKKKIAAKDKDVTCKNCIRQMQKKGVDV